MMDFQFAIRSLRSRPLFTLVATLTLALGIGANTAIFSLVYHFLLRPLPFPNADRLVFIWNSYPKGGSEPSHVAIPDYLDRRSSAPALEDATLFTAHPAVLSVNGQPEQLVSLAVTPSFFTTLRRGPFAGRAFREGDDAPGADGLAILTFPMWASHFASDPSVIGRDIRLDGRPHRVVGVLPADFELPVRNVSLLTPFSFTSAQRSDGERGNEFSMMIGRLKPGATPSQLNAQMQAIVNVLIGRLPGRAAFMRNTGFTGIAIPMRAEMVKDVQSWLLLLQIGVLVLLLIACVNVANLVLMRASGRHRDLAIRAALGAGRWRLARQLLAEAAVLSALGAAAGGAAAIAGVKGLMALAGERLAVQGNAVIQPAVLAFTLAVAVLTTIVFGMAPAASILRGAAVLGLNDAARGACGQRFKVAGAILAAAEMAMAVVLLAAAGLLIKGFARLTRVDPGFSPDHVLTAQIALPSVRYRDPVSQREFWDRLLERSRQIPGVQSAGSISTIPFSGPISSGTFTVAGRTLAPTAKLPHARIDLVAGDYFQAMGIALLNGKLFDASVAPDGPRVVVVDQFLASQQFSGINPLGQQLNFGGGRNYTIIGVVRTISDSNLAVPAPEGRAYLSEQQVPSLEMGLAVKTHIDPQAVVAALRQAVREIDSEQAIAEVETMDQWISRSLTGRRMPMTLLTLFGMVAVTLAAIGIYGVLAYRVSQRLREFGIRQALGADRGAILSLVLRQGLGSAGAGIAIGLAAAVAVTRYMQSLLFEVRPFDAGVFAGVAATVLAVGLLACYFPARRATQVDPAAALRNM